MFSTNSGLILVASHPLFSSNIRKKNVIPYNKKTLKLERYNVSKLSILALSRALIYLRNKNTYMKNSCLPYTNQNFIFVFKVLC